MVYKNAAKVILWAGRIIVLPVLVFFIIFGTGEFIDTLTTKGIYQAINGIEGFLTGMTLCLALAGVIISWWQPLLAGIILILAYVSGGLSSGLEAVHHVGFIHWSQFRDFWTIPGITYLTAGILFIIAWYLLKKADRTHSK
jgi:hypothetical protein